MKVNAETTIYGKDRMQKEITSMNTKIEQSEESIILSANKYTDDKVASTSESLNSKIEQTASNINLSVNRLKSDLGSANLIKNSSTPNISATQNDCIISFDLTEKLKSNTDYTVTVKVKGDGIGAQIKYDVYNFDGDTQIYYANRLTSHLLINDYVGWNDGIYNLHFSTSDTVPSTDYDGTWLAVDIPDFGFFVDEGNMQIEWVMLEYGTTSSYQWKNASQDVSSAQAELSLKVSKDDNNQIVSMINASADVIKLNSNRFSMKSDKSEISEDGTVKFTSGTIGGWKIDNSSLGGTSVTESGDTYKIDLSPTGFVIFLRKFSADGTTVSNFFLMEDGTLVSRSLARFIGGILLDGDIKVGQDFNYYSASKDGSTWNYHTIRNYINGAKLNRSEAGKVDYYLDIINDTFYRNKIVCFGDIVIDGDLKIWAYDILTEDYAYRSLSHYINGRDGSGDDPLVTSASRIWRSEFIQTSDRRLKNSIEPLNTASSVEFINKLKPVKYKFNGRDEVHHGFIAQDVDEIVNDWNIVDKSDNPNDTMSLRYTEIIADLVATVQSQNERINKLEETISSLQKQIKLL